MIEKLRENEKVKSVVAYKSGRILEQYDREINCSKAYPVNSITKTIVSLLVGIAIDKKYMENINDDIRKYIPSAKKATLREHLTMTSGIDWGKETIKEPYSKELINSSSWVDYINSKEIIEKERGKFKYSGASSHLLAKAVSVSSSMKLEEFAKRYLCDPLGITLIENPEKIDYELSSSKWTSVASWDTDPEENNIGSFGLRLKANDLLSLGVLILNKGLFNGERIVSNSYIESMTAPHIKAGLLDYGYHIWIRKIRGVKTFSALGYGNQYLTVMPDFNSVIVIISETNGTESIEIEKAHGELVHLLSKA